MIPLFENLRSASYINKVTKGRSSESGLRDVITVNLMQAWFGHKTIDVAAVPSR